MDLDEAVDEILNGIRPLASIESIAVANARGRVAARDVRAAVSLPPFPASAMDGFAVQTSALAGRPPFEMAIAGESFAGRPFEGNAAPDSSVRIFTGAAMPEGFDAVAVQENCDNLDGHRVLLRARVAPGENVRPVGDDVKSGNIIVNAGDVLTPFAVGWLAACGEALVDVRPRPRVAIFSTGDELREPGSQLHPGQIYDANRFLMTSLLASLPVEISDLGILPDDPTLTANLLAQAAAEADVLLTSGGVSVGDADHVTDAVRQVGDLRIWRLHLKPGKPLAYGRIGRCHFFGLPGNPVSTAVTLLLVARPALMQLCGANRDDPPVYTAAVDELIRHRPGREEYQRGTVYTTPGGARVRTTGGQGSNRLASLRDANCLIRIPKESEDLPPGSRVAVLPFFGLI